MGRAARRARPAATLTRREHRARPTDRGRQRRGAALGRPGRRPCLVATAAAADGGPAALRRGRADAARAARRAGGRASGIERVHVITRPRVAEAVARRRADVAGARVRGPGRRPARDRRASPRRRPARSSSPTATSSPSARCSPACSPSRGSRPACSPPAAPPRGPFGFKTRSRAGASSPPARPTTPCAARPGRSSACSRSRPTDAPASRRGRAAGRRWSTPAPPTDWQEELDHKAGHWRRMLALRADGPRAAAQPPPDARGARRRCRSRRRTPPSSSAGARARPTTSPRCCSSALIRSGVHVGASRPALAVLGAPALAAPRSSARPRRSSSTTRTVSCSTRRSRARTASSPRSSSALLEVHRALGRAPRADAEPGHAVLARASACWPRRCFAYRRALGHGRAARVLLYFAFVVRLRRRPARPLHAPVLQARRLARLDLRPHEGVRRVRGPRRSARAARATGLGPRRRRADAADRRATRSTSPSRPRSTRRSPRRRSRRSRSRSTARARPRARPSRSRPTRSSRARAEAPSPRRSG